MSISDMRPQWRTDGDRLASAELTLRDYFAAKAMQALIAGNIANAKPDDRSWIEADQWAPGVAYEVSDAMLQERAK